MSRGARAAVLRRFLARRLAALVPTFLGITLITFMAVEMLPGDAADVAVAGAPGAGAEVAPARGGGDARVVARLRTRWGLDRPLPERYAAWLSRLCRFDFGVSLRDGRPVRDEIAERLPRTLLLALLAALLATVIAVPAGVLSAARAGSAVDRGVSTGLFAAALMPPTWLAALGIVFLGGGAYLDVLPVMGFASDDAEALPLLARAGDVAWHLALPVVCLALPAAGVLARVTRAAVVEALAQDYVRTARAKGLSPSRVLWHHAFRGALGSVLAVASSLVPALIGGAAIVEIVFAIPGLGWLGAQALAARDLPVLMATTSAAALVTLAGFTAADVVQAVADPRSTVAEASA